MVIDNDATAGAPPGVQLADCGACGQRVPVIRMFSEPHDYWRFAIHRMIGPTGIDCASSGTVSAGPFYPLDTDAVKIADYGSIDLVVTPSTTDAPGDDGLPESKEQFVEVTQWENGRKGNNYTMPIADLWSCTDAMFDGAEPGATYLLTMVEMTRAEFDSLPEFEGF